MIFAAFACLTPSSQSPVNRAFSRAADLYGRTVRWATASAPALLGVYAVLIAITCPYRKLEPDIDDAIHRGWAVVGYFRLRARGAGSARPSPAIGVFEHCCSNPCKTVANAAGAARRTQRHDRDIPDGSNRSGAPHSRSARAIAVMSDEPNPPSEQIAIAGIPIADLVHRSALPAKGLCELVR
jgi:hypothetical protein